ncbi:MAG TPA: HAMP domain-containing sensor histidine kinase [Steroidobacteraceae bacterium]|nr:HAMP domain-containing sensor histidine kinase [Steroidobacteraceae bacterium]
MQWVRPKSLSGLMLFGLGLLALPLLVAIITAALQIRTLATTGQKIVIEGVTSARASQQLFSQIASLERTARLYDVLNDPKILDSYEQGNQALSATRAKLYVNATAGTRRTLAELGSVQRNIRATVLTTAVSNGAAETTGLAKQFSAMSSLVDQVAQESNQQIDAEVASLQRQTDHARARLFWEAAGLLPVTLIEIITLTLMVGRPLRQIDRAIDEIGHGKISHPIEVKGPHDLERLGAQLEWLRLRLVEVAQERNRFLRHMSHELKTPLANIREGTELLMDGAVGELDPGQREVTAILRDNGIKLQRMIENLLSFSAWQTSSVGLETSEFRLRPVVKQVLENQQLTLLSQRVRLDVQVEDVTLVADRSKMRLILENLVSNAVKYSPKGGTIHIKAATAASSLIMDVADNGPGIPKEDRDHVFEAFYTGRAARSTAVKGTGIGLSVVLEFVAAHGGTVQIVDGEYPGAHFRIRMPINLARGGRPGDTPQRRTEAHAA